ncbi:MAG TPA: hypothetical protein GXX57_01865 [Firmicutes bacterium]|nr:hypothetical protein [Bacillota bacterium]
MKRFRYRKPSVKTVLGITKAKKRIKKATGITAATKPLRAGTNFRRRVKRKVGYYSTAGKIVRHGKLPTPLGCCVPVLVLFVFVLGLLSLVVFAAVR